MEKLLLIVAFLIAGVSLSAETGSQSFAGGTGPDSGNAHNAHNAGITRGSHNGEFDKAYDVASIRLAIDSIARENEIPSVAFAVVNRDGIIVADAVGYANVEKSIPATSTSIYRIGSVTKTFIALGVMHLVYEGKLNLDDRLSDIVPEVPVKNRWEESHPVRLIHLLEHTAGFRDLFLADFAVPEGTPLPDLKDAVMREPRYWVSRWQPGTRNAYSNPGYTLLGYIIEKYSGKSYDEYLKEILLEPIGMVDSDFLGRDHSRLALSYDRSNNPQTPLPILDHPAGYLHTTPEDMAKFIHFMLLSGQTGSASYLSEEVFAMMASPSSIVGADNKMAGYGSGIFTTVAKGHTGFGHDGGIDEYLSSFAVYRDQGVAYYFTTTRMDGAASSAIGDYFKDMLLDFRPPVSDNLPVTDTNTEGWYRFHSHRLELTRILHDLLDPVKLEVVDDTLRRISFTGEMISFIHLGEGYYRMEESPLPTHFIGEYDDRMVISSSFGQSAGYYEKTGAFRALWKTWLFLISNIAFLLFAVIYTVNYLVIKIKGRKTNSGPLKWMALGLLSLILLILSFSRLDNFMLITTVNAFSVTLAVFSALFAFTFVFGFLSLRKGKTHKKAWKRIPLLMGYFAWAIILIILFSYGHMPLTTWIW